MSCAHWNALLKLLFLQASAGNTLHYLALEEDEYDQHRQAREDSGSHDLCVAYTVGGLYCRQAHGDRHHIVAGDDDEGPDKVVPRNHKGEDRHSSDSRAREWHPDLPVDAPAARSIHDRGLFQFMRNAVEELFEDEDRDGRGDLRQDDAPPCIYQSERLHLCEERHDQHRAGDHNSRQDDPEEDSAPPEGHARQREGSHAGEDHRQDSDDRRCYKAVEVPGRQAGRVDGFDEGVHVEVSREPGERDNGGLTLRLERRVDGPQQRYDPDDRQDYQQDKGTGICQPVPERPVRSYTRGSCPPGLSYAICCHQLFPLCWRCSMLNHTAEMTATSIKKMKDMADAKPTRNVEKPDS